MPRSKAEIISEMVDAGFTDDEIRGAFNKTPAQQSMYSKEGFSQNVLSDAGNQLRGAAELGAYANPALAAMKNISGENIYNPARVGMLGKGMVQGLKEIPAQMGQEIAHPIDSLYQRPFSTAMDFQMLGGLGVGAAKLGAAATRGISRELLPGIVRGTAGIPEMATKMALEKPSILSQAPIPESELNKVVGKPVIQMMKEMKKEIGGRFGDVYRHHAGMEGPMQEIVDTPIAQKLRKIETKTPFAQELKMVETKDPHTGITKKQFVPGEEISTTKTSYKPGELTALPRKGHSYNDLLVNKNLAEQAFEKGDQGAFKKLYKEYVGTPKSDVDLLKTSDKDKLQILTRLKRETQQLAKFNKAPITNAPIDTAKDAAFKTISADLDKIRGQFHGGGALAKVDDAYKSLNDIYDTVQKDLSDPGKAKDTMMRLLRGDNTWLTTGRMKTKMDAIRRVEAATGKKILEPAMEELTRQVFKEHMGKGFFANLTRTAATALAGGGIATGNPLALAAAGATLASSSPKLIGGAIKGGSAMGEAIAKAVPAAKLAILSGASSQILNAAGKAEEVPMKPLTKDKAYEFLKRAKNNKRNARRLAKKEGYTWDGDF